MDSRTSGLVATGEYCVCGGLVKRLDRRPVKARGEFGGPFCANCGARGKALRCRHFPGLDKERQAQALRLWQREERLAARVYPTLCLAAGQAPPQAAGDVRLLVAEVDEKALKEAMRTLAAAQNRRAAEAEQAGGPKRLRVYEAAILIGIVTPYMALSTLARLIGRHWATLVLEKVQPVTRPRPRRVGFLLHRPAPAFAGLTEAPQAFCVSVCPTATVQRT